MKKQVLRIMELCLQLKEEKGYDIFFKWVPHCEKVSVRHSDTYKWDLGYHSHFYSVYAYIDEPEDSKKLSEIVNHLKSLL